MKKFKLQLDDLRIDSFSTTPAQAPKGTVFAEQCTCYTNCTCDPSCDGNSCDPTCYGFVTYPGDDMPCIIC